MTDGIIKGTGNSRFLRGPANIRALYPTWDSALEALAAGTFPIDLNGINPSGWEQTGMALNKANLLADSTATGMGLTAAATHNEALAKLRSLISTAQTAADTSAYIELGSYTGSGGNTQSISFRKKPILVVIGSPATSSSSNKAGVFIRGLSQVIGANEYFHTKTTYTCSFGTYSVTVPSVFAYSSYTYYYAAVTAN